MAGSEGTPIEPPVEPPVEQPAGSRQRGGARRAAKPKRTLQPRLLLLGLAALAALAGWGVLVWLAIGFGGDARDGDSGKWGYLAGASVAAVALLFLALWLFTTLLRRLGILEDNRTPAPEVPHRH